MEMKNLYSYEDVLALYGNHQTAGQALGCDPANLGHWKRSGEVPANRQLQLMHILDNDKTLRMELAKARRARTRAARAAK